MQSKIASVVVAAGLLSSCVSFLPTYDEALFKHLESVNDDLSRIEAAVNVVYLPPPKFEKVETFYVDAIAHLALAQQIANGQRDYYRGRISGSPSAQLQSAIANCNQALKLQMNRHREGPINPKTLAVFATADACSIPKLMAGRLKRKN